MQSIVVPTQPNQRNFHKQLEKKWCPGDPAVPGYSTKASEALRVFNDLADAGGLSRALVVLLLVLLSSIAYGGRQEAMGGIPVYIGMVRNFERFWNVK